MRCPQHSLCVGAKSEKFGTKVCKTTNPRSPFAGLVARLATYTQPYTIRPRARRVTSFLPDAFIANMTGADRRKLLFGGQNYKPRTLAHRSILEEKKPSWTGAWTLLVCFRTDCKIAAIPSPPYRVYFFYGLPVSHE